MALCSGLGLQQMGMHCENPEGCDLTHIWDSANSSSFLGGGTLMGEGTRESDVARGVINSLFAFFLSS